jgi:hypothetical protein
MAESGFLPGFSGFLPIANIALSLEILHEIKKT